MARKILGVTCSVLGVLILWWPGPSAGLDPVKPNPKADLVSEAFDTYENLWRKHAIDTADKIAAGDFKTEKAVWDYIAAAQAPARRVAFNDIAKSEADHFKTQGGWSLKAHENLLRGYAKEPENE